MRLLMITRRVDRDDGLAGFTYNWIKKLSSRVDKLEVICLEKGTSDWLPANVSVYSLGKETGKNRFREFWRFQGLARRIVPEVDGVFTHQNPEYGILIAPWTKIFRKKLIAWYTHKQVSWRLRLLNSLADIMVTASVDSFRLPSKKLKVLQHGIDTKLFSYGARSDQAVINLLSVSRLSSTKKIDQMIDLVARLKSSLKQPIIFKIVGAPTLPKDREYFSSLKAQVNKLGLAAQVQFLGSVANDQTPALYQEADIFLNFSQTGSVDKTVLEAMSTGALVLVSNEAFKDILEPLNPYLYINDIESADKNIKELLNLDREALGLKLRDYVLNHHNLDILMDKIVNLFKK